jgi:hypothetical protein
MRSHPALVSAVVLSLCAPLAYASSPIPLLPEALEMELALSAAPERVSSAATVLRLTDDGYVEVRKGTNGFTCLVQRSNPRSVAPMCYDVEGTRTVVPVIRDEAVRRAHGESNEAIERATEEGFRSGKYEAPEKPGISYMISPVQELVGPDGTVRSFMPHLMFYAPNTTDADIGGERGGLAFMNGTNPDGMIIVPLGKEERSAILAAQQELVRKVKEFLASSTR